MTDYRAGFRQICGHRLQAIRVFAGGEPVRQYLLEYTTAASNCSTVGATPASTVISRLSSVTQQDATFSSYLPPIQFSYTEFDPAWACTHIMQNAPDWDLAPASPGQPETGVDLFDVDGDGLPDLVNGFNPGGWNWARNCDGISFDSCFTSSGPSAMPNSPAGSLSWGDVSLFDLDGDASPDYVIKGATNYEYRLYDGGGVWEANNQQFCSNPTFDFDDPSVGFSISTSTRTSTPSV